MLLRGIGSFDERQAKRESSNDEKLENLLFIIG